MIWYKCEGGDYVPCQRLMEAERQKRRRRAYRIGMFDRVKENK
ncbi:hypothetical protein [Clostridium sp. KNHs205]|nr:hypothetical protein [Clostridium sp. KNHs205]